MTANLPSLGEEREAPVFLALPLRPCPVRCEALPRPEEKSRGADGEPWRSAVTRRSNGFPQLSPAPALSKVRRCSEECVRGEEKGKRWRGRVLGDGRRAPSSGRWVTVWHHQRVNSLHNGVLQPSKKAFKRNPPNLCSFRICVILVYRSSTTVSFVKESGFIPPLINLFFLI